MGVKEIRKGFVIFKQSLILSWIDITTIFLFVSLKMVSKKVSNYFSISCDYFFNVWCYRKTQKRVRWPRFLLNCNQHIKIHLSAKLKKNKASLNYRNFKEALNLLYTLFFWATLKDIKKKKERKGKFPVYDWCCPFNANLFCCHGCRWMSLLWCAFLTRHWTMALNSFHLVFMECLRQMSLRLFICVVDTLTTW